MATTTPPTTPRRRATPAEAAAFAAAARVTIEALELRRLREARNGWLDNARRAKAAGDAAMVPHYVKAAFRIHDDLIFWGRLWGILPA